ncbi:hypothetical protein PCANC_07507 [Puccinia coronata f. sp. avenae]|uniref:Uncharacterized protein n=1 Tax=Puccinia coronata f. sp. avenae TaxID=200324 RepID=A0A2N5VTB7_9BASI|nr:hypothetical protein PCANC_07507 [Puccinia coronata f. sp. avenae]
MPSLSGLQASSSPFLYGQACFPSDPPSLPLAPTPSTSTYGLQPGDMADDVDNQPVPPPAQPQQSDNLVDQLACQVTRLRGNLSCLFEMLDSGARLRPEETHPPSPPGPQFDSGQFPQGHPHPVPAFIPRMEPPRLPDVWFSGDSGQLLSFLRTIQDHLWPWVSFFESDTCRIIWISRHFGYAPSSQRRGTAASLVKNWYTSLVTNNARRQVKDVEEACVERYVLGLNPCIVAQAMSKEWRGANTLDKRMDLATEAAAVELRPVLGRRQRCEGMDAVELPSGVSWSAAEWG